MSVKKRGKDTILYSPTVGTLVTTGDLNVDSWYKIRAFGATTALPDVFDTGQIFRTPEGAADQITLAVGDEVWPLTLTEICKADIEFSAESDVIEATDSCDGQYDSNMISGFTNLSGSIGTFLRFDEETEELVQVTTDYLNKFFDIVTDDGEGTYVMSGKDDSDIIMMILLNATAQDTEGMVENWLITPAILSSASMNMPLKEALGADFAWSKGQGPASLYQRTVTGVS